ncbi:MAG: NAD(P)-dependent oxidoreductase [Alphaproteobacteria bacterium]|nr:NAD(P)-dependent oxidoreductase [Alphaproteobacteria bacterium]
MLERIGYIGVGLMGGPMARRLAERGYAVRAHDIVPSRRAAAAAAGATEADSPADAARDADIVALNLPTTQAVEAAVFGPRGAAEAMRPPAVLVDFSTIEVERCRDFAARLYAATGCTWNDAPVSGGPVASADGTLTVMAGGEASDIARLQSFFGAIAANFTHVGRTGDGLVAKMISQHIVGCLHTVLAEAVRLAELSGMDATMIPAAVAGGHADGVLLRQLYPRLVARDFQPRAYARQLVKDMHMVEALAGGVGLPTPMLRQSCAMYEALLERGGAEMDVSAVVTMYET